MITGFNAFQYAGNSAVALGEARRVTRPGGGGVVMTWDDPEGMEAHAKALAPFRQPDGSYRIAATFRCLLARP